MRLFALIVLGWAASASVAVAQGTGPATGDVPAIHFDLAKQPAPKPEKLPEATTLDQLTYASDSVTDDPAHPAHAARAAPKLKAKAKPKPKPRAAAVPANGPDGKPISAWRRAYIASHGHQPPVAAH